MRISTISAALAGMLCAASLHAAGHPANILSFSAAAPQESSSQSADASQFATLLPEAPSTPAPLWFVPVTPCRIADTRLGSGPFGAPELAANSTREFDIPQSACNIPSSAVAYSLNVTAVPNTSLSYLTLWPSGQAQPNVSTLNSDGRIKANAAIVPAGANGGVSVYVTDATQLILDINGYFVPAGSAGALEFYPLTPCRISDTRNPDGSLGGPSLTAGQTRSFPTESGSCNIPQAAQAISLNVTAIPHTTLDYLTSWPSADLQPNVSTLNATTGAVTANAAIVPTFAGGAISIFVSDAADVILDVNGYFAPPSSSGLALYPVTPCRVLDTRLTAGAFDNVLPVNVESSTCAPSATAQAYVFNATVVPPASLDYLTLWPQGEAQPNVSTLNALDAAITSNMAIVPTNNGNIDAFASNSTNLILDISSYFGPGLANASPPVFSPSAGTYNNPLTVSLSDSTPGAIIYYTIDGTTPTQSSTLYLQPFTVSSSETINAFATAPYYSPSAVATAAYAIDVTAATPALTPAAGTYSGTIMVTIADSTPGAVIHYTTNGATPTASSPQYSGEIAVSSSETIQAIAAAPGAAQSAVASSAYLIAPAAAAPAISPASGSYSGSQTVAITDTTPGAVIYYTTNGTVPTAASTPYNGQFTLASSETVEAIAVAPAYATSAVAASTFSIATGTVPEIVTVAGNGSFGYGGDGGIATAASFEVPGTIAVDSAGNFYIADIDNNRVRKVAAGTFIITTIAGNGTSGFGGDGGPATSAELSNPNSVAVDSAGNIYISDNGNRRIRKVAAGTGIITTFAGNGASGFSGDGGPATNASFGYLSDISLDSSGNLYIADSNYCTIRKITASSGVIATVAGSGASCVSSGDGGLAASAGFRPYGVAVDGVGNIYISDGDFRVREVQANSGYIFTVAGTGNYGFSGDGGPATSATIILGNLSGIAVDSAGNLYLADYQNNRIRKITASTGIITTIAGDSASGYSGDGGPAVAAQLNLPTSIAVDKNGNLYIFDGYNGVVREISTDPPILAHQTPAPWFWNQPGVYFNAQPVSIADSMATAAIYYTTDGSTPTASSTLYTGPITVASSQTINAIAISPGDQPSLVSSGAYSITAVTSPEIVTVAGDGDFGYEGDGGVATATALSQPNGVAADGAGNIYIADTYNSRIRKVAASTGIISTVAGNGLIYYAGDGGPATAAGLNRPNGVAVDNAGNIYIADTFNSRIRKVTASTGIISTVAGNGMNGNSGNGGLATNAELAFPLSVAVDSAGNIYIVDSECLIQKVTASTGLINNVAGTGNCGYSGDGGPATSGSLWEPNDVAVDGSGNLYIADTFNSRIRKVTASTGVISTLAGNGVSGYGGDGGPATSATLSEPDGVAVDSAGNVYIADTLNARLRMVAANTGTITTIAGNGIHGFSGDEGPAIAAELIAPYGVSVDSAGDVFLSDSALSLVKEVSTAPHNWGRSLPEPIILLPGGIYDGPQQVALTYQAVPRPVIYYTTDGSTPTTASPVYVNPITITQSTTLNAIAVLPGYGPSRVAFANYSIQPAAAETPTLSLVSGVYNGAQTLSITDTTPGASIYYSTNGFPPSANSTLYTSPIPLSSYTKVQAIAVAPGYSTSAVAIGLYVFPQ